MTPQGNPDGAPHHAVTVKSGRTVLDETVMTKVLHGWLQNRHQTLFPLAVNLRTLEPAARGTLAQMAAIGLLADGGEAAGRAARALHLRAWLEAAGAEADTMAALDEALADPPALSQVIDSALSHGIASHAYVVGVVVLSGKEGAAAHLLAYLAARLALPVTLVRSANRRFGK